MKINEIRRKNLLEIIKKYKNQRSFSEKVDLAPSYVSQIVNGVNATGGRNIGEKTAEKIERALKLTPGWFDKINFKTEINEEAAIYNAAKIRDNASIVPLISWVQAGEWTEIVNNEQPENEYETVFVPRNVSPRSYALRVEGDSMTSNTGGDSFPPGTKIVVDPEQQAKNGSYVVVRLDNDDTATFKQLVIDGSRRYLKPINNRYPIIEISVPATICGVVRAAITDYD